LQAALGPRARPRQLCREDTTAGGGGGDSAKAWSPWRHSTGRRLVGEPGCARRGRRGPGRSRGAGTLAARLGGALGRAGATEGGGWPVSNAAYLAARLGGGWLAGEGKGEGADGWEEGGRERQPAAGREKEAAG
jgi:hypothetical protein